MQRLLSLNLLGSPVSNFEARRLTQDDGLVGGRTTEVPMARKLTSRVLQQRYGVVDRTIDRWAKAGILPKPMRINRIRYWDEEDIQQLERDRMAKGVKPEAA